MRKELTWLAFALLASIVTVFVLMGNDTLDLSIRGNTFILPSWTWTLPVFLLFSFVVLIVQVLRERFCDRVRCICFVALGIVMMLILQSLRAYTIELDTLLNEGQVRGISFSAKQLLYSRNSLWILGSLQLVILVFILVVTYFCWIRTKDHAHHQKN